jgi:hypothetical protein
MRQERKALALGRVCTPAVGVLEENTDLLFPIKNKF